MVKRYEKGLKDLVGFQLVDLTKEKILVRSPQGEIYTLFIEDDEGDCYRSSRRSLCTDSPSH